MIEFLWADELRDYRAGEYYQRGWQVGLVIFTVGRFAIIRWCNMTGWA